MIKKWLAFYALALTSVHAEPIPIPSGVPPYEEEETMEDEDEVAGRDRDSERPTLYDWNKQNVDYNRRYNYDQQSDYRQNNNSNNYNSQEQYYYYDR